MSRKNEIYVKSELEHDIIGLIPEELEHMPHNIYMESDLYITKQYIKQGVLKYHTADNGKRNRKKYNAMMYNSKIIKCPTCHKFVKYDNYYFHIKRPICYNNKFK